MNNIDRINSWFEMLSESERIQITHSHKPNNFNDKWGDFWYDMDNLQKMKIYCDYNKIKVDTEYEKVCGLCQHYSSDMIFCSLHPDYGELCERDFCSDYEECE